MNAHSLSPRLCEDFILWGYNMHPRDGFLVFKYPLVDEWLSNSCNGSKSEVYTILFTAITGTSVTCTHNSAQLR